MVQNRRFRLDGRSNSVGHERLGPARAPRATIEALREHGWELNHAEVDALMRTEVGLWRVHFGQGAAGRIGEIQSESSRSPCRKRHFDIVTRRDVALRDASNIRPIIDGQTLTMRDFIYAARALRSNLAFSMAAVLTIALGVGACTAIFSVANAVLLRPLPYKDPGRLVYVCADLRHRQLLDFLWSSPDLADLRANAGSSFNDAAGVNTFRAVYRRENGSSEEIPQANVTPNFFRVLGARVILGRDFADSDAEPQPTGPNGQPGPPDRQLAVYGIISHEAFERRFGGNPAVLGQPIAKGGAIIVGVLEPGFELLFPPDKNIEQKPDLWIAARVAPGGPRIVVQWRVIARLRPGATIEQAQSQADAVAAHSRAVEPAYRGADLHFRVEPMQRHLTAQSRPAIIALMGAAVSLLLIACSNVANLFLVRASLHARDLALRAALGANWWRLLQQRMAEALLVSALGAAFGFALASIGIKNLLAISPANLPRRDSIGVDAATLAFTIGAGVCAAFFFGILPAFRASRPDLAQVLRASGRTSGLAGGSLVRNLVVVAEVALCFILLVASGLLFRSFIALKRIDPGFDSRSSLELRLTGGRQGATPAERAAIIRQIHGALAAIPGVESVTAANILPLSGAITPYRWGTADAQHDESKYQEFDVETILPGYFAAMRTPILHGREFDESDNQPGLNRIIVDEMLAAKAFPNGNAVGQRILSRFRSVEPAWFEIVGVAAHQRMASLAEPGREQGYLPDGFWGSQFVADWALRTRGNRLVRA